jgi:putative membrane protein
MRILINLIISAIAVIIGAYLIPGVQVSSFMDAILVAIIIALLNTFLKPILYDQVTKNPK